MPYVHGKAPSHDLPAAASVYLPQETDLQEQAFLPVAAPASDPQGMTALLERLLIQSDEQLALSLLANEAQVEKSGAGVTSAEVELGALIPVWKEYFRKGYNANTQVVIDHTEELKVKLEQSGEKLEKSLRQLKKANAKKLLPALYAYVASVENSTPTGVRSSTREFTAALLAAVEALLSLDANMLMSRVEEEEANKSGVLAALAENVSASLSGQAPQAEPDSTLRNVIEQAVTVPVALTRLNESGIRGINAQVEQLGRSRSILMEANYAATRLLDGLAATVSSVPADALAMTETAGYQARGKTLWQSLMRNPGNKGDARIALMAAVYDIRQPLKSIAAEVEEARRRRQAVAKEVAKDVLLLAGDKATSGFLLSLKKY